jgi:DNA-binding transcriptional MocR family regulator
MMADFASGFRDDVDINLGVGYVNEKTIPSPLMAEALAAVAANPLKYRQAFNYGGPGGSPNLVAALRRFILDHGIGELDPATLARKRIVVGPCGATSILDALAALLPPGIVVTADPSYYIYTEALERRGFEVLAIPEDHNGMDVAELERKLASIDTTRISFFYVVTVNNPSCSILSNARRRALLDVATRVSIAGRRAIPLIYDLAYELLLHDPAAPRFVSALPADSLGIAYEVGTLSKILAPALRIGYMLGPDGPLLDAMVQRTSDVGFSAPLFVQEMAAYLLETHVVQQLQDVNAAYRAKALAVRARIERLLGPFIEDITGGSAGFYFYLTLRDIETHPDSPFFRFLTRTTGNPVIDGDSNNLNRRVIYIPGDYCVHPGGDIAARGKRQLRLSYGFEDVSSILAALEVMREAADFARGR